MCTERESSYYISVIARALPQTVARCIENKNCASHILHICLYICSSFKCILYKVNNLPMNVQLSPSVYFLWSHFGICGMMVIEGVMNIDVFLSSAFPYVELQNNNPVGSLMFWTLLFPLTTSQIQLQTCPLLFYL